MGLFLEQDPANIQMVMCTLDNSKMMRFTERESKTVPKENVWF